ncbi:MAG: hypothetical protein LBJ79_01445 [Endomicrobium sp.]|nr:hypothetical protein [Endomicrobium sp.]
MDVLAFFAFIIVAMAMALFTNEVIEKSFPLTALSFITILFLSGFVGNLIVGLFVIYTCVSFSICYIIYKFSKNFKRSFDLIIRPGFIVILFLFPIALIWHRYPTFVWDEKVQWALAVKNSFILDKFAACPLSNKSYASYPPALELFHYFWTKTCMAYKESSLFVSMNILTLSFLVSILHKFSWKYIFRGIVASTLAVVLPYTVFHGCFFNLTPYSTIFADPIMGIVFGWVLYTYFESRDKFNNTSFASISLGLFIIPIIKDTGILFSLGAIFLIFIDKISLLFKQYQSKVLKFYNFKIILIQIIVLLICSCLSRVLWSLLINYYGIRPQWSWSLNFCFSSLPAHRVAMFFNYFRGIFNYNVIKVVDSAKYFVGPFVVSPIVYIIMLIFLSAGLLHLYGNGKRIEKIPFFLGLFAGLFLYMSFIFLVELLYFSDGEASLWHSRYINTYMVAIFFLCVSLCLNKLAVSKHPPKLVWFLVCMYLLSIHIPIKATPLKLLNRDAMIIQKRANEKVENHKSYLSKLKQYLPKDAILHCYGKDVDIGTTLAVIVPIKMATALWQSGDFSWYRTYCKILGYTHVFFENIIEEKHMFRQKYSDLFIGGERAIKDYSLYKVEWIDEKPMLRYIITLKRDKND